MKKPVFLILVLLLFKQSTLLWAQRLNTDTIHYQHAFTFTSDNDVYLAQAKDGYYTNGIYAKWQKTTNTRHHSTAIQSWQIAQAIYTPRSRRDFRLNGIDRPFCGYSYIQFERLYLKPTSTTWFWNVRLGMIGPLSMGKLVQEGYHHLFGFPPFKGWEKQIGNELNLNAQIGWYQQQSFAPQLHAVYGVSAEAGNAFIRSKASTYVCWGTILPLSQSALLGAQTGKQAECFVYWQPQIIYQAYNATVQGGLFNHYSTEVTDAIAHWQYQQNWGFVYSKKRWAFKIEVVYQTKEAALQAAPQRYGSIGFTHLY